MILPNLRLGPRHICQKAAQAQPTWRKMSPSRWRRRNSLGYGRGSARRRLTAIAQSNRPIGRPWGGADGQSRDCRFAKRERI